MTVKVGQVWESFPESEWGFVVVSYAGADREGERHWKVLLLWDDMGQAGKLEEQPERFVEEGHRLVGDGSLPPGAAVG